MKWFNKLNSKYGVKVQKSLNKENVGNIENNPKKFVIVGSPGTGNISSITCPNFFDTSNTDRFVNSVDDKNCESPSKGTSVNLRNCYEKNEVKQMLCKAIDNIPDCAKIMDCYTEHSFMSDKAFIKICIEVLDKTDENIIDFHNKAHEAFESGMGFFS